MNIIRKRREELGISQTELGKRLGVSQQHINRFENNYPVPIKHVPKLAKALQMDVKELLPKEFQEFDFNDEINASRVKIDMLDATACCGKGVENVTENVIGLWSMPLEEFQSITFSKPENIKMLRVFGDSMETTLSDGDWVLADISKNFIDSDGIFLIRMTSGLAVKRIQNTIGNDIVIKSDNPKYDNITAAASDVYVVGKVIYTLKAEKVG